ncbi:phospho-acceptor domain-containing protein [Algoriphagus ratkowskyi]|uniref:histidine kinase n=1 Tax=Algoriphagus ratkowskyi TaxID=57028 RepID=A0A2W7RNF8_9BACT|nr:HAMP domain-containing sensor histidine kinase [Algoriphagus ratkowskyi]PZX55989.1 phospho-acceptor domain-containing protein [Algoriphagus ratkowskyi]TXD77198.1 HAMP domain-containing histidine kinase [Algoriphagus ratkowskyi]
MKHDSRRLIILISIFSLLAVLILNFFFFQKSDQDTYLQALQDRVQKVDRAFDEDFIRVLMDVRPDDTLSFGQTSTPNHSYPFFILSPDKKLVYWSDFSLTLDFSQVDLTREYQLLEDPYGTLLLKVRNVKRNGVDYVMLHVLRLIWPGNIENNYLITGANPEIFGNDRFELFANPDEASLIVTNLAGIPLFGVNFLFGYIPSGRVVNPAILIFFTSIFLLYFLLSFGFVLSKWKKGLRWQAIGYAILVLGGFRMMMLLLDFPSNVLNLSLFNSSNYASSWFNPSLGDLMINTLCGCLILGMVIFQLASKAMHEKIAVLKSHREFLVFFFFAVIVSSIGVYMVWSLPRDLMLNSQWGLDISSIPSFDWFKGISFFMLFLWGAVYVLISLTMFSLLLEINPRKNVYYKWLVIVGLPMAGVLFYFTVWGGVVCLIHLGFLFAIIRLELFKNAFKLGLDTFLTFFFACLVTAIISGISTFQAEKSELIQSKTRFANQNLIENDVMTEFFLGEIFTRIKGDLFIQNRISDPLFSKEPIETKIRRIYLDNYFDQFEVQVRIFAASGQQILGPSNSQNLKDLQLEYIKSDNATSVKDLYFIRGNESNNGNRFLAFVPMSKESSSLGTVFLELRQLRVQSTSVYPKLLLDKKYNDKLDPVVYDYSIFQDKEFIRNSGSFNYLSKDFERVLARNSLFTDGVSQGGYHHFGINNGDEVIIVSSKIITLAHFFGNISLFFVLFVIMTFMTILTNTLATGVKNFEFNYSTKLQLYLNFAFFFPILIISIITIGLLANSYRNDLDRQYIQKATLIRGNLGSFLNNQKPEEVNSDDLNEEVNELANTTASDIHLYSVEGKLESTNRPNIFDKKILSPLINPKAIAEIQEMGQSQYLADEQVGNLRYKAVYLSIPATANQKNLGILAVPFFESETELNTLIADVLSNIFNAFVVIFILFLFVSYFVSTNLTFPFKLLTQKLKATNLENNEPMYWGSKDEIGLLVNEYNNMLFKLENSKKVLATTEKESAWREMAKQVAHEIKNPLTPMKLTLQHLIRLQDAGRLDEPEKLKRSLETLIHQVDALSGIASSFSTFAKMPLPNNELINFKSVLNKVLELFSGDQQLELVFQDDSFKKDIPIMGDDKLFGRVISNLIINGMQAVEPGTKPVIKIWLWLTDQAVFLEITDNGKGISDELKDKIFIPNFSTKSTGSGLGLAIAKSGVETAGGKIWFDTELGKGTTFYLTFPLIG